MQGSVSIVSKSANKRDKGRVWITGGELARLLEVSQQAVSANSRPGKRLHPHRRESDGLYDRDASLEAWDRTREQLPPVRAERAEKPATADACPHCGAKRDLLHWKTLATREEYRAKRLARRELQASLVERDRAEQLPAELAATTRSLLEKVGAAVRDDLAAESDPRRCGDIVNAEIRLVLEQAAQSYAESVGMDLDDPNDMGLASPVDDEEGEE